MGQAKRADWTRGPSPWKGAALGAVIEKPEHAYGIAARLQHRLPGADLTAGDIYPVLRRLLDARLVEISAHLPVGQTQARVTYRVTETGVTEFEEWLRRRSDLPRLRNELMVKVAVARPGNRGDLEALLVQLEEAHTDLLALMAEYDDEESGQLPAGSWARVVHDIERDHALAHWQADLTVVDRARRRLRRHLELLRR